MFFDERARPDKNRAQYQDPNVKETMEENAEQVDFKDLIALTIAGLQVLAPRVIILTLSYLLIIVLFILFVA